ncbi:hypothetical protein [Nonomuraea sp. NPDC002799]
MGQNVKLEPVPSSPTQVGEIARVVAGPGGAGDHPNDDRRIGSGTSPAGCELGQAGCAMTVLVRRDYAAPRRGQPGTARPAGG